MPKSNYGKELILDIHNCDVSKFTRKSIKSYFIKLCDLIGMKRGSLHWWDYQGYPEEYTKAPTHLKGISAIQFISTSNITIHTLDELKHIYINLFSCKEFNIEEVKDFSKEFFRGFIVHSQIVERI